MIRSYKIISDGIHYCKPHPKLMKKIKHLFEVNQIVRWKLVAGKIRRVPEFETSYILGKYSNKDKFYIGSLPRVLDYCNENEIYTRVRPLDKTLNLRLKNINYSRPKLKKIKFREDQYKAITCTIHNNLGRIIAPTRSGKTIVQLGIASMIPDKNILILAHTKDLVKQLGEDARKYLYHPNIVYTPRNSKEIKETIVKIKKNSGIVICTIQSLIRINILRYQKIFDLVIVDECHHVNKWNSMYGKTLLTLKTPRRYGFTATLPTEKAEKLFNEGILGKVIFELSYSEAVNKKIIAKPKVMMTRVKYNPHIVKNLNYDSSYEEYYNTCIVNNEDRNKIVADMVKLSMAFNEPTLIIIEKIQHGKKIKEAIKKEIGIDVPFAKGSTSPKERSKHIKDIKSGKQLITICSRIWMEGITMQNLKVVIYSAGMKDQKRVIQAMGRGLGITEDKDSITLLDFVDPYKYLQKHSTMRKKIYKSKGWKVVERKHYGYSRIF